MLRFINAESAQHLAKMSQKLDHNTTVLRSDNEDFFVRIVDKQQVKSEFSEAKDRDGPVSNRIQHGHWGPG